MRKERVKRRWVPGRQTLSPLPAWSDPQEPPAARRDEEDRRTADVTYDPCYGRIELVRTRRGTNED